jgi:hypothetical protein
VSPDQLPQVFEPEPDEDRTPVPRWPHMTREQAVAFLWPEIERRMSEGETLTAICAFEERFEPDGRRNLVRRLPRTFPDRSTVYAWCEDPAVARRFARARALCIEAWEDQKLAIADDDSRDWIATDRGLVFDSEHVQRSKLRIWTRDQLIRRCPGHRPGDAAAANGVQKIAPPRIDVVGIIPRGQEHLYQPGEPIEGVSVRVDDDEDDDE